MSSELFFRALSSAKIVGISNLHTSTLRLTLHSAESEVILLTLGFCSWELRLGKVVLAHPDEIDFPENVSRLIGVSVLRISWHFVALCPEENNFLFAKIFLSDASVLVLMRHPSSKDNSEREFRADLLEISLSEKTMSFLDDGSIEFTSGDRNPLKSKFEDGNFMS